MEMSASAIQFISKSTVLPTESTTSGEASQHPRSIPLTPWDLRFLSIEYIQKGILLPQPPVAEASILPRLLSSLSLALGHFSPLAGRLATSKHDTTPPSLSVSIDYCSNQGGAELIHAAAKDIKVTDILSPPYVPRVVWSFFPLVGAVCHDGHSLPLLAIQVTELADGIFIGCSVNHAVIDGTSFWHFFNSWSEISRTGSSQISRPPVLDRWFPETCPPPIHLPFDDLSKFIRRCTVVPHAAEAFFHFSKQTIAKLKAKANMEMKTDKISSLKALLAHVWRSVVRARRLEPEQETFYIIATGVRPRIEPPLPAEYFGNGLVGSGAKALAGEVVERGLGWVAWQLHQAVATNSDIGIRSFLEAWVKNPCFVYFDRWDGRNLLTGSSPRFDIYGNDFGWGKPLAVRSGAANKMDGKVTVYPGREEGSMDLEVCLAPQTLASLVEDEEFMEAVSSK